MFLKNRNITSKIKRSKVTDYAALNGVSLAADDAPTMNAGLVVLGFLRGSGPVLLGNPIFRDFSEGGPVRTRYPPSRSAHDDLYFMYK